MTLKTLGMGIVKYLKTKKSSSDLKKIHDKYFDKSGMKQKGKDIVKEGLKGLGKKKKTKYIKRHPHQGVSSQASDWPYWRGEE